jgi:hypothetical protein
MTECREHAMKNGLAVLVGFAALLRVAPPMTQAEDISNADLLARIEQLEAQIEQRAEFASHSEGGEETVYQAELYEASPAAGGCSTSNWYAGYELTILRPWVSNAFEFGDGLSDEYGYGHRFTLGCDNCTGVGIRMRYWFYNHGHDVESPTKGPDTLSFDMDVADLEMTLRGEFCYWDLMVSGGVRYGRLAIGWIPFESHTYFEGFGPTVALEARRQAPCRGLYLVGNLRSSMLMGRIANPDFLLLTPTEIEDEITLVLENQLGVGWTRGVVNLRAVWETQFWLNDTYADDFFGFGTNFTFTGLALQAEVRY